VGFLPPACLAPGFLIAWKPYWELSHDSWTTLLKASWLWWRVQMAAATGPRWCILPNGRNILLQMIVADGTAGNYGMDTMWEAHNRDMSAWKTEMHRSRVSIVVYHIIVLSETRPRACLWLWYIWDSRLPLEDTSKLCFKGTCHQFDCQLGHYGTNTRCAKGHASPITKKSEMCFNIARRWFDCQLGSLWH
jgi:hypothetical protein